MFPVIWWAIAAVVGTLIVTTLTISLLKDKVREVIKNDSTLENKVVTCKINELRNSGGYNIVSVGLRSNDNVIGSIDIKAEEVDSEIKVGKAFTI